MNKPYKIKEGTNPQRDMTDVEIILFLIEHVDPTDSQVLDEIDVRTHAFVFGYKLGMAESSFLAEPDILVAQRKDGSTVAGCRAIQYTRSRDALKAIRPDWKIQYEGCDTMFVFEMFKCIPAAEDYLEEIEISSPYLPTEELAELHAIIQAIDHDRKTK